MDLEKWVPHDPDSLTLEQAVEIMNYKKRSTYRALTQKYLGYECSMTGESLSKDVACRILGVTRQELSETGFDKDSLSYAEYEHVCGGFFFWE